MKPLCCGSELLDELMNASSNLIRFLFVYEMPNSIHDHHILKQRNILLETTFVYVVLCPNRIVGQV